MLLWSASSALNPGEIPNVIYGLSCICHPEAGIRYVGLATRGYSARWKTHLYDVKRFAHKNLPLHNWINKHGADNIDHSILEECSSKEILSNREIFWIAHYRSIKTDMLNITDGGNGVIGYRHSDETKVRISNTLKSRQLSDEAKKNIGDSARLRFTGRPLSEQAKKKLSDARKGIQQSPERAEISRESIKKAIEARKGSSSSDETRDKIRRARLGSTLSQETRDKISRSGKGRMTSLEAKKKLSESNRSKLTDIQVREIRKKLLGGALGTEISIEYGISTTMVSMIRLRKKWAHIDD